MMNNSNPGKINPDFNEPYQHRDVVTLKSIQDWTPEDKAVHLEHNRILQPEFLGKQDKNELLERATLSGEDWLTDFVCPSPRAALMMHLAKEMSVYYRVHEDEIGLIAQEAYLVLADENHEIFDELEHTIEEEFDRYRANNLTDELIKEKAQARLEKNGREINQENMEAAKNIILDIERRKITNKSIKKYLSHKRMFSIQLKLDLEEKTVYTKGKNHDYAFQGAAGSGKSTISRQFLSDDDKRDCVYYGTDIYRGVSLPRSELKEKNYCHCP